jgi:hypothetical protein
MGLSSSPVKGQRNIVPVVDHSFGLRSRWACPVEIYNFGDAAVVGIVGTSNRLGDVATAVLGNDARESVVIIPNILSQFTCVTNSYQIAMGFDDNGRVAFIESLLWPMYVN